MSKWKVSVRNITAMTVLFGIILLSSIWGGVYLEMHKERQEELQNAAHDVNSYARMFAEHMERTIKGLDGIALYLAERAEREGLALDLPRLMEEKRFRWQPIAGLAILDEKGDLVASTQVSHLPINNSSLEGFRVHRDDSGRELFISKPQVHKANGKTVIQLTRRINYADGSFRGVVVVAVDPYYLADFYMQGDLGDQTEIALIGWDGVVRLWQSGGHVRVGQEWNKAELMGKLDADGARPLVMPSPMDGVNRISAYRALQEYPLIVLEGIAEERVLATVQKRIAGYYWLGGLMSAVVALFIALQLRGIKRREQAEERLRLLLTSTAEGIYGVDLAGNCTFANPAAVRMLGCQNEGELLGKNIHSLMRYAYPDGTPMPLEECRIYRTMRVAQGTHVDDAVLWKADGTSFPAEYWAYPQYKDGEVIGAVVAFMDITERRQVSDALRESERRMRAITESARDAIIMMDAQGRVSFWNTEAERTFGYTSEEIIGQNLHQCIAPQRYHEAHGDAFRKFQHTGEGDAIGARLELTGRHKDGHEIAVELSLAGIRLRDEWHSIGILRDITERKQAEEAIKASEARILLLLNSTAEGIYGLDLAGNCTFANPAAIRMLGYREEGELLGKNMHWLIHHSCPDGRPMPEEECRIYRAFRAARGMHVDDEVLWKADGTSFPVEYWSYPQCKDGEVTGAVVTFLDITQRRAAETALRDSEARYRILVDNASDIVYGLSEDGILEYLSPSAEKSLGYPVNALVGRPFESLVHPDDRANCWEWVKAVFAGESLRDVEYRIRHSNGTWRWYSASAVPTKDSSGRVVGHYGIGRDVTERKAAEEQIRYLATRDALTGLLTMRLAREQAAAFLRLASRQGTMAAVMFVDLDGFKMINDTYGHDAGDATLKRVAETLTASVRESDTVARAGGDEFLVFAAGLSSADNARTIAEKILANLSGPIVWNGKQCMVGASIGIALYPADGEDMEQLIRQADTAMYEVKRKGKNGYRFAGEPGPSELT